MDDLSGLLRAVADGRPDALSEFVGQSQPDVWRFCAALLGPTEADDATQETFLRVWRAARSYRGEAAARTWMLAIARRVCYDQLRRRGRRPVVVAGLPVEPTDPASAGAELELTELISRLMPDRRSAFVLTQLHGLSYEEAAAVCECPVGTIRSRVARARADLVEALGDEDQLTDDQAGS